ncbi:carbohydrate binding domain-containing protein [Kitasatospora sp. NPDC056184]|uniref:carbohydrate binding domain-containing protein n=1 Tax=Kitasatospora sp. NPDC056184 TaxID=3345738 RepID=UPI0035DEB28E
MRALPHSRPARPARGRRPGGLSVGLAVAGLVATAASTVGLAASAAEPLPYVNLVLNGNFDSYPWIWACDANVRSSSIPHNHYVTGLPTADNNARCSQRVRVLPNSTYTLYATVRGPFAFAGVSGAAGENASTWSSQGDWNNLSVNVTTGPDTTELTVYFHGWYEQAAFDVRSVSFIGPGYEPHPCGDQATPSPTATDGPASPTPSPTCRRTYIP